MERDKEIEKEGKGLECVNGEKFVVSLVDNSCSCNFWSIVGVKLLASIPIVVVGFTFIKEFISTGSSSLSVKTKNQTKMQYLDTT